MRYKFKSINFPGSEHKGADFTSRNLANHGPGTEGELACLEESYACLADEVRVRPFRSLLAGIRLNQENRDVLEALDREQKMIGSLLSRLAGISEDNSIRAITRERIQEESAKEPVMRNLVRLIRMCCPEM